MPSSEPSSIRSRAFAIGDRRHSQKEPIIQTDRRDKLPL